MCFTRDGPAIPSQGSVFFSSGAAGATPLHLSAFHGHLEICRLLLQCNADPQAKGRNAFARSPQTSVAPLQGSVENGHIEICRLLLQCHADPNQKAMSSISHGPQSPLHISASRGNLAMCRLLLEHNADIKCEMECHEFKTERFGSPYQRQDKKYGRTFKTACQLAIDHGHEDVAKYLRPTSQLSHGW